MTGVPKTLKAYYVREMVCEVVYLTRNTRTFKRRKPRASCEEAGPEQTLGCVYLQQHQPPPRLSFQPSCGATRADSGTTTRCGRRMAKVK